MVDNSKFCSIIKLSSFFNIIFLFLRATSQADMRACPFGDCRKGQIPRSCGVFDYSIGNPEKFQTQVIEKKKTIKYNGGK